MGIKLIEFYDKAKKIGGIDAIMQLGTITRIPSSKAYEAPDTNENIQSFESAMTELKSQFLNRGKN